MYLPRNISSLFRDAVRLVRNVLFLFLIHRNKKTKNQTRIMSVWHQTGSGIPDGRIFYTISATAGHFPN